MRFLTPERLALWIGGDLRGLGGFAAFPGTRDDATALANAADHLLISFLNGQDTPHNQPKRP